MNKRKIVVYILVVVVVLACVYCSYAWGKKTWPFGLGKYQVVQLTSGEVYYGKLSRFPCFKLTDVYFVQQAQETEGATSTTQLVPLSSIFFNPENTIYLQKSQVLWWADLSKDSPVLQAIGGLRK